jgi:hypothetical protein
MRRRTPTRPRASGQRARRPRPSTRIGAGGLSPLFSEEQTSDHRALGSAKGILHRSKYVCLLMGRVRPHAAFSVSEEAKERARETLRAADIDPDSV